MIDIGDIDRIWREGLRSAATDGAPLSDPRPRVAGRVRRNRRMRIGLNAAVAIALVAALAVGVGVFVNRPNGSRSRVAAAPVPRTDVNVTDAPGGTLSITFPGSPAAGEPPALTVPAGDVHFVIRLDSGGHELVLDGAPDFSAVTAAAPGIVTRDVRLAPGRYLLHCLIPGHTAAGEEAVLIVR